MINYRLQRRTRREEEEAWKCEETAETMQRVSERMDKAAILVLFSLNTNNR